MKTKGILLNRKCVPRFNSYGNCMEITFMTLKRKMTGFEEEDDEE